MTQNTNALVGLTPEQQAVLKQAQANIAAVKAQSKMASAIAEPALATAAPMRSYEGFMAVAMRAHARGQRVLPIRVGAKSPSMSWKGSVIDTDNRVQWKDHSLQWIQECVAKFPDDAVCVIAKPEEFCFIDEDSSDEFRQSYEKFAGEPFPRTFTTESRPNHRQSHWLQTDATRELGNVPQVNGLAFSFRQNNQYVLSEGSPHPKGTFYDVFDGSPIAPMPDKLVEYMRRLEQQAQAQAQQQVKTPTEHMSSANSSVSADIDTTPNGPNIPHGSHDVTLTKIGGKIHHDEPELGEDELCERLVVICEARCENYGSDYREMCRKIAHSVHRYPVHDSTVLHNGVPVKELAEQKKLAESSTAMTASTQPNAIAPVDVSNWRSKFRNIAQMDQGDPVMIIEGVLQDGTCFLGAAPGHGKTLVALAIAKAIGLGTPLFELAQFSVKKPYPVIYLIPETSDRPFRKRCEAFRIPSDDRFIARTITEGASLKLTDPDLLEAVRQLKPVVILDTARRFNSSSDTNSDAENQKLVANIIDLRAAGAVCVIILHHATKAANQKKQAMTLENMLSGTGDFGAMCDQAYGIRMDEALYNRGSGPMEIEIVNLKDRERVGGLTSLRLAASYKKDGKAPQSCIDETGNFRAVGDKETMERNNQRLIDLVKAHPLMTVTELVEETGIKKYTVQQTLKGLSWHRTKGGPNGSSPWHQDVAGKCPFDKPGSGQAAA
jgi:hypothetical protein